MINYILFAVIVGLIKTVAYYRSHIRYESKNATRKQIRGAIILTLLGSTALAPLVVLDFIVEIIRKIKGGFKS